MLATSVLFLTLANSSAVDGSPALHGTDEMWSDFSPAFSWRFPKRPELSKTLNSPCVFQCKMKSNIRVLAISDQLIGGVAASIWQGIRSQCLSFIFSLIESSVSDPDWLNLDILVLQRPAGQRTIQLLLDPSAFTLKSAPILSTYFTFSHPSFAWLCSVFPV